MNIFNPNNIIALIVALSIHEFAHAYTAYMLGDKTSYDRVSLNPLKHLDPFGTLMLFLVGFGWGKPVSVNPYNFKNPKRDISIVALAGPISNIIVAFIASIIINVVNMQGLNILLYYIIYLNLGLAVFNMIPFYPLDGSKAIWLFLSQDIINRLEPLYAKGPIILISIILIDNFLHMPILSSFIYFIIGKILYLFDLLI